MKKSFGIVLLFLLLSACNQEPGNTNTSHPEEAGETDRTPAQTQAQDASTLALRSLAEDVWSRSLDQSTYLRLQYGLPIERFEDITLAQHRENLAAKAAFRQKLGKIDPANLGPDDLITFEILTFELADDGANDNDYWLTFDITAYQAPYLFRFAQQALAAQVITDEAHANHYLHLSNELADLVDQLVAKVEGQTERGIYLPRPALPAVRATWEGMGANMPGAILPADERLQSLSPQVRDTFRAKLDALISTRIEPGFDNLLLAIGPDYEENAPEAVGLSQYPGGREVYQRLIRQHTTLELSPDAIHERGLAAVADIAARMESIRNQLEFEGTAQEFVQEIKADPRFIAESPAEVEERFMAYIARVEPKIDSYFRTTPKAAYGVRRLPPAAEAGMTYGYYGTPTEQEPVGYYNYNASDLPNRSLIWAGSLIYHELLPGHHFHIATQNENEALPDFRKNYLVGAYTEGWAEYAASLGIEMGLYETPEELYGRYIAEMFLATRLVVDTGMNALGWSLEEARDYMRQYVVQAESEIDSETLRYSTSIPGQALNYRLGYEQHWKLRKRAEAELGDKFDIRDYHDVVLSDGAKPLGVLEAKVNRYIEANR